MINSNCNNDDESKTSSALLINNNNETNNNNSKTKSIESYEQRFLNSLKQLNAPEWYSMNVSSSSSTTTSTSLKCLNSNKKYDSSYSSTNNTNTNNVTRKSIIDSTTSQALLNSHKQKYDRIRQRYRSQQRQSREQTTNTENNLITPQKRDLSLNKSTRSLGYNIRQSYIDSNEQVDEKENIKNTNNNNNNNILINYSKSAYSLNNNDLLLNLNNNDLMKRSQSGYNNNRSNNSIISNDDPALISTVTGQATGSSKSRPLWLSHSALQNKSSSTINSFTSNCSNWYKPKNLQLPPHLLNSSSQDKQETTTNG
jgi:hypothetical protein